MFASLKLIIMEKDKPNRGRKKITGGIKKQIVCTPNEFEKIKKLLNEIRKK